MANKKIVCLIVFAALLCTVGFAYGQGSSSATIKPPPGMPETFPELLKNIIKGVGALIASLGTIMIIVAGILYLTSGGSQERMGVAKKALIYAIAGIAIGLAAGPIVDIIAGIVQKT